MIFDDDKNEDSDLDEDEEKGEDSQIDNLKEEVEVLESKWKRALADYQNLERRYQEGRRDLILSANQELILKLLPVLDALFLASDHIDDEGLRLSIQKFLDVLKDEGVEQIKTKGEKFDPNTMEGLGVTEGPEGKVVEEIRSGFTLNDKVIRPAQVRVGGKQ